jgi:hypothetical protein
MKNRIARLMLIITVIATIGDWLRPLSIDSGWTSVTVLSAQAGEPGFQVEAYNDSLTLGLSDADTYNLLLDPSGGFTGAVVCDVSGLPDGASGAFTPPEGPPHPGPFALTVTTDATVQPGTYQPTVTCVNGTSSDSKELALSVTADPDFRVVLEPNSLTLSQGQKGVASFEIKAMNGFGQGVTLAASGLPAGTSAVFTPASLIPTATGTVQFTAGIQTTPSVYQLSIRATSGTLTRQAAFELTVVTGNAAGSWRQQAMGDTPALFYGVIVGDVGNTGMNRVYGSGGSGVMYEYSFDGISWSFSRMPVGVAGDAEMHNMDIGPARGDGVNRLYIAVSGGDKVYECSWVTGNWQCVIMATPAGATDIIIGDGRNDGRTRMYVTSMTGLTEFTWTGTSWSSVVISNTEGGWVHGIDLGPGRNDGINRVYTANQSNGEIYEYSWNGAWTKLLMGTTIDSRNIEVGQGRNDGKYRVYMPSGDSNMYEFTWNGSSWQKASIGNAGVAGVKVQSIPAAARADDWLRIYAASSDGGVDEYTWTGSAWQTLRLGRATAYMYGLERGDGLNKGTTQIYGASYDGQAYLFEWVPAAPTDTEPPTAPTGLVATGSLGSASLTWNASSDNLGVTLYNIHRSTQGGFTVSSANRIGQSSTASYTDTGLAPGTYYYRVTAQDAAANVSGSSNEATTTVTGDTTAPTVTATNPVSGAIGVATDADVTGTFSEGMQPATISTATFELRNPANALIAATVTYDNATRTATLRPNAALAASTTYTATIKGGAAGAKDLAGNPLASNVTWSFTTAAPAPWACPCTIWPATTAPARIETSDTNAVEVGVKFRADVNGSISALRFYKGSTNTGTHVGHLWTSTGTLLSTATFTSETASGWQQVNLSSPVNIAANTTYVASYYSPTGRYAVSDPYFTASFDRPPLHALANGEEGGNGVYRYGSGGGFPTQSYNSSNYWVDVVFQPAVADSTPPTVTTVAPPNGATGVSTATTVTATFSEAMDPATIGATTFELRNPANAVVAGTVSYNSATRTATLVPSAALANGTTYTATVRGGATDPRVKDVAGNALAANSTWSFTTAAASPGNCPCSIWSPTAAPSRIETSDTASVELGVRFRADVNGSITGLRFYKGSTTTGTHTGKLWSNTGTLLASLTFINETAAGWQQANFANPVAITANTTYVASYHTNVGNYAVTEPYFTTAVDRAPLHALASGAGGGNGIYRYGSSAFPNQTYNASNYWIDVVFVPAAPMSADAAIDRRSVAPNIAAVSTRSNPVAILRSPATSEKPEPVHGGALNEPGSKGRTLAAIFSHVHNIRRKWLRLSAHI